MKRVVLKIAGKTVAQKMEKASFVVQKMTENAGDFPTPNPPLADITNQVERLNAAEVNASQGGKDRTSERDVQLKKLESMLDLQVLYVQNVSLGDTIIAEKAGMEVQEDPSPWPKPLKPENLRANPGEYEGSVYLIWDPVDYKRDYVVQRFYEDKEGGGEWRDILTQGRYSVTIHGLARGIVYRFRLYATNANGQSPYSNEATSPAR